MQCNIGKQDTYIGVTENEFKTRYNQHTSSFKLEHRLSTTHLYEHIWKLKKSKIDQTVKWEILDKALPYSASTETYALRRELMSCTKDRHPTNDVTCSAHAPPPKKKKERRKRLLQNVKLKNENRDGTRKKYMPDVDNRNAPSPDNG